MTKLAKLNSYSILEVKGADALTFLQGQVSQDLRTIELSSAKWFGLSNAKGRLLAIGQAYLAEADTFWLVLPNEIAESLPTYLMRYKFRSKVEFKVREDLHAFGLWDGASDAYDTLFKLSETSDCHIVISSDGLETNATEDDWTKQKILAGLPDVFGTTQETFVAQMLNLDLINGISFSKGCYTGQEIIARMQHRGRIKRRILAFELENELAIGDKFEVDGQSLGQAVNVVKSDDKYLALVCVQLDKLNNTSLNTLTSTYSIPELDND